MSSRNGKRREIKPLKVSCTDFDCESELHCFKKSRRMTEAERGNCRSCGISVVNWTRVHSRSINDAAYTFEALNSEFVRNHFWNKPIDLKAENHARRKGRSKLREAIRARLKKSVGTASPSFDGRQTPDHGNIIYYAQHALACCCRTCMEYWHGIPKGVELSDEQIDYFTELIMKYVDARMPELTEEGENIPRIRHSRDEESQD
ncbi:MAG: DUF4186 family protein [Anaerolineales bacterium]|nr:DUF4186 family protein [Anaerolineales bacterium]